MFAPPRGVTFLPGSGGETLAGKRLSICERLQRSVVLPDLFSKGIDPQAILGYPSPRMNLPPLQMGADARVRSGTVVYVGSTIGARFQTGHNVVIREECTIGDDVSVWSNSVVDYGCRIGSRVKIHSNCYVAQFTEIEDDAFLAPGVTVANDFYPGQPSSARLMSGPRIGAGAQVGVNVTILPFVRIGPGTLIGAGAVVVRDIPARSVAYGNPARVCGKVDDLPPVETRIQPVDGSASRYRFARSSGS
jgi:acetyltransferase-like isoleucine patch superfamily enzyme